ncbi:mitotic-spindle organizing protein 2 isoform X2 [Lepisosteus oculatus]|uniref:mitotic-spindle organizing protein 2 isoform X2 n=1 Tax=Lepisosteus oculatus TaxID=7918 RepID=UPI0007403F0C|nr:PREDICTED: mitotic-spindle organizing protein 2-like isoform X2 [Lepisosteus oculatus]
MALSQQAAALAPSLEPPALVATVSGNVQKYALKKKKVLSAEETDLFELAQAAGITVDQEVFKIIVDLLKMNVAPLAVFQMLKAMCAGQRIADTSAGESLSGSQHIAAPEPRVDDSFVSGKSSKIPAPLSLSSGLRPARVNTKIVVYSPADSCSPISQVRAKAGSGGAGQAHGERGGRDGSSQRVPRQPSASRGQKSGKSSGSSSSSSQLTSS